MEFAIGLGTGTPDAITGIGLWRNWNNAEAHR